MIRKIIDIHAIHSVPLGNLNRDDNDNPKTGRFGGVKRNRVSSQCWKHYIREYMLENSGEDQLFGIRSRLFSPDIIIPELQKRLPDVPIENLASLVNSFLDAHLAKIEDKNGIAKNMVFLSQGELNEIIYLIVENYDELVDKDTAPKTRKKMIDTLIKHYREHSNALDISLFGRMMASTSDLQVEGAVQFAHATSTHSSELTDDFFVGLDDLAKPGAGSAAMIGYAPLTSSCFYRFANININTLLENLRGDVELSDKAIRLFLDAFVKSIPGGKQNSSAAVTPPSMVVAIVRNGGQGLSLANAFEKPISPDINGGYILPSVLALESAYKRAERLFGKQTVGTRVFLLDELPVEAFGKPVDDFDNWLDQVIALVKE